MPTRSSRIFLPILLFLAVSILSAQKSSSAEDAVSAGGTPTSIGGYGNALYQRNFNDATSLVDLERMVLFVGHRFTPSIAFFSELEVEDAKTSGGEPGGEVAFEQAFVKFTLDREHSIVAGLFLPRIGILNEEHLPTNLNGNERTQVETWILPSTWRELGVGFSGSVPSRSIEYGIALVNGLNSAGFEHGSGIREGRFEGRNASANNLALTAALRWSFVGWRAQLSGYYGGTVGLNAKDADSLGLPSGPLAAPVAIGEADVRYDAGRFSFRALATVVSIPNAYEINRAYGNNTPQREFGAYVEGGYNLLESGRSDALNLFIRYEALDMNASIPSNGIDDGTLRQQHIVAGVSYLPVSGIVVKADVRIASTGDANPVLAGANAGSYKATNTFLNLGIGFSF